MRRVVLTTLSFGHHNWAYRIQTREISALQIEMNYTFYSIQYMYTETQTLLFLVLNCNVFIKISFKQYYTKDE